MGTVLDRIADGYFSVDGQWRIRSINAAARRVLEAATGRPSKDLAGRELWEVVPGLQGTRFEEEYRTALREKRSAHFEAEFQVWHVWFDVDLYPSGDGLEVYFRDITERKRVEEALRENESLFRQLAETMREVLWVMSPDLSKLQYLNPAYEEIFGRPREEIGTDAHPLFDAIFPDDRPGLLDSLRLVGERERELVTEFRIVRPGGEVRWIWTRALAVRDEDGEVARIVGISEDVTGRREMDEQRAFLAEATRVLSSSLDYEETLRTVTRLAVPEIADWCAIYVLEGGEMRTIEVAHVDPAKVALARDLAVRYPDDPAGDSGVYRVLRTGEPEFFPDIPAALIESIARDREHLDLLRQLGLRSGMTVPMSARGRSIGAITFIAAESGRRYSEYDLRFAEQLASRAAMAVDNARLYAEAHRRAIEERALREAAGAVAASFTVGEVIEQIAHSALEACSADGAFVEQVDEPAGVVRVVASRGQCALPKATIIPASGSFAEYVLERQRPIFIRRLAEADRPLPPALVDGCGDSGALVVPLTDADEAIGALFLLRGAARGPFTEEDAVRASTFGKLAALAFRKVHLLEESEKRRTELEQVMESRARLVRGFTHDLRNPLGAADGFLDLVESGIYGSLSEQQQTAVGRTRRLLRDALGLIGDVLELARVEAGLPDMEPATLDVREAARDVAEEYRPQAEAKGLALDVRVPPELPLVLSDAGRIRQILGNLMSNAVKFTRAGHVAVAVERRQSGPRGASPEWIAIDVRDTGPGIPDDEQGLLFREFSRVGTQQEDGVGLGLAISRSLAEAIGGALTLQSEIGRGSTFTLWIPLIREHAPATD